MLLVLQIVVITATTGSGAAFVPTAPPAARRSIMTPAHPPKLGLLQFLLLQLMLLILVLRAITGANTPLVECQYSYCY